MQQKLEEKDDNTIEIKETYTSLQQEVELKTKKLKKVATRCYPLWESSSITFAGLET